MGSVGILRMGFSATPTHMDPWLGLQNEQIPYILPGFRLGVFHLRVMGLSHPHNWRIFTNLANLGMEATWTNEQEGCYVVSQLQKLTGQQMGSEKEGKIQWRTVGCSPQHKLCGILPMVTGNVVLFDDTGMEPVNENDKQHTLHSVPTKLCVLNHHPLY